MCKIHVEDNERSVVCLQCKAWYHGECLNIPEEEIVRLRMDGSVQWMCSRCQMMQSNYLVWGGGRKTELEFKEILTQCYREIITWRKNIFPLPHGNCGESFIKEITRLLNQFNLKSRWERLSLLLVHIFTPLMLQKPSRKSKPREHTQFLACRLQKWKDGDIESLMSEAREIQKRLAKSIALDKKNEIAKEKAREQTFVKNMMFGKVGPAAKFINNEDSTKGVHTLTDEIKEILLSKHPQSREVNDAAVVHPRDRPPVEPVIFQEIDEELVEKLAKQLKGSGGPTQIDADTWKAFLCSRSYGRSSVQLRQAVADFCRTLCTEEVHSDCLAEFNACRLIPLDKGMTKDLTPGVRPIGVGEVLRRLSGKLLIHVIKDDITEAAGPLQTCSGVKSGIEAAIHAIREKFEADSTEGVLLVDAENAFNNLNRKTALQNIKEICPPFHRYLYNTYQTPASLVINDHSRHDTIFSNEGCTQGDATAMALYALGISPLVQKLGENFDPDDLIQCWFADDSSSAGKLLHLREWWDNLCSNGPQYGYYPLAKKTVLIVKPEYKDVAEEIFRNSEVTITISGDRHMGAVIGSNDYKLKYVSEKVKKWVRDIEQLSELAKDEPQAVYSCYVKAICHRWTFLQRTVPDVNGPSRSTEFSYGKDS